jgi:hypothetical protein
MQLEAAIEHLKEGNWPCAVTLAGAAEGCLPDHEGSGFRAMVNVGLSRIGKGDDLGIEAGKLGIVDKTDLISALNGERDWLKHFNRDQPETWQIVQDDAVIMIFRAMSKLHAHREITTPALEWFEQYMRSEYAHFLLPPQA